MQSVLHVRDKMVLYILFDIIVLCRTRMQTLKGVVVLCITLHYNQGLVIHQSDLFS